ncbi:hypothetical protein COOONC_01945 [Cooperia oncophora]
MTKCGHASASERQRFLERSRDYSFGSEAISELVASHRTMLEFRGNGDVSYATQAMKRNEGERPPYEFSSPENYHKSRTLRKLKVLTRYPHSSPQEDVETDTLSSACEDSEPEESLPERHEEEDRDTPGGRRQCYFNRMGERMFLVADANRASESPNPTSDGDEPSPKFRVVDSDTILSSRIRRIEEKVERMKEDLKHFPFRDRRDRSEGVHPWRTCAFCDEQGTHFSDACSRVRDGDARSASWWHEVGVTYRFDLPIEFD